jgi:GDPmannose 4,6-dehydratase
VCVFLDYLKKNPNTKLFLAQSSELYGKNIDNHKKNIFEPCSPYAVAKLASYHLGKIYREKYNLFIVNGLFYIHESPLRNINFFCRKVSQTVAKIAAGMEKEIILGNIDLYRDIGFAGDYMEAVYLAMQLDVPDDYIIATGECTLLRDFVKLAFAEVGVHDYEKYIRFEESYVRKNDPVKMVGFPSQTFQKLGWRPKISVLDIVRQMVAHDVEFIKNPQNIKSQLVVPYVSILLNRS